MFTHGAYTAADTKNRSSCTADPLNMAFFTDNLFARTYNGVFVGSMFRLRRRAKLKPADNILSAGRTQTFTDYDVTLNWLLALRRLAELDALLRRTCREYPYSRCYADTFAQLPFHASLLVGLHVLSVDNIVKTT